MTSIRTHIAFALAPSVFAVLYGAGTLVVLCLPGLADHSARLLPNAMLVAFFATPPIAYALAPRLRARRAAPPPRNDRR